MTNAQILVVEDEAIVAKDIQNSLKRLGYTVSGVVSSGEEAIRKVEENLPDLVLMDIMLKGDMDGIEAAQQIHERFNIAVVYLTAYSDDNTLKRAKTTEPFGYILKPFDEKELQTTIEMALYRHQMDRKVKESEERYRILFEESKDAIYITTREGKLMDVNQAGLDLFGYTEEEMIGMDVREMLANPSDRHTFEQEMEQKGSVRDYGLKFCKKDGTEMDCLLTSNVRRANDGTILGYQGIIRDITERNKVERERALLERELNQAQKLESIGTLAAGIAHEINTPIQFIGDNTRFISDGINELLILIGTYRDLLSMCEPGEKTNIAIKKGQEIEEKIDLPFLEEEIPLAINQTLEGVERVAKIVGAMKDFSHMGTNEKSREDINKAIESTITISRNEWKYVAEMKSEFAPTLPLVECFIGDIKQVVLNLIVNAAHAIKDALADKEGEKGLITVMTRHEKHSAIISVSDTGTGIPEEIQDKIFDPFFTTKDVGKGTGQGLSLSYSTIVEKHGGKLRFETELGKGTTFFIELPLE